MTLIISVRNTLDQLVTLMDQLTPSQFSFPHPALNGSTIGQHARHVIEMFQCLLGQYDQGVINYDLRERNTLIETLLGFAIRCLEEIKEQIDRPEKDLVLEQMVGGARLCLTTNYFRELLYNLEHCVHHQALIRVVVNELENVTIQEEFGVAQSTTNFRKQCAQ